MVEDWRAHIPDGVREIRLVPQDIDGEDPTMFWEKLGFHEDGQLPWSEGTDVHTMSRRLDG